MDLLYPGQHLPQQGWELGGQEGRGVDFLSTILSPAVHPSGDF